MLATTLATTLCQILTKHKGDIRGDYWDNYFFMFLAHKFDRTSHFALVPFDIIQIISTIHQIVAPLKWVMLDDDKCKMTFSDENQTCANLANGYRVQPFFSEEPITRGTILFSYFIEKAKPRSTVEIGICSSDIFNQLWEESSNSCDCSVRLNQKAYLYSWHGGAGYCYGNTNSELFFGYTIGEHMIMEINMEKKELNFYKEGNHNFEKKELTAQYKNIPDSVIPICYFLGSGYEGTVTLKESLLISY